MPTLEDIQHEIARRDFSTFLDYVYILQASGQGTPGGPIKFVKWPHLMDVATTLQRDRRIAWLKSRQLGASWLTATYLLWQAMYHPGTIIPQFAQNEDKAKDLISKQKFIFRNLPPALQVQPKSLDNQLILEWPEIGSMLHSFPSTMDATRGMTGSIAWFDEFDFHEYASQAYEATAPIINDVGGQIILTSTSNPDTAVEGSTFKTIYSQAAEMGFTPIFYGWNARPDRSNDWYDEARKATTDPFRFEKENAASDVEALAPPSTLVAFRRDILDSMKLDVRPPARVLNGTINIYQEFIPRKRYVAATDTGHGLGADYSVTVVMDAYTGYVVADIIDQTLDPEALAYSSDLLLRMYGSPTWAIEDNEWGHSTIMRAIALGYTNLYYQAEDKPGWHTDSMNRFPMWSELVEAIHNRLITIPSKEGLDQFYTVIRNPKKQGRMEAQSGRHDDYPTALAMALQLQKDQQAYSRTQPTSPIFIARW